MAKNIDRRVQKTHKLLQDALIELIEEKGYESITVQQILERANVGRSTFYSHFQYKDELLHSCFDDIKAVFEQLNQQFSSSGGVTVDTRAADPILRLFEFAGRNHRFFKALLGKQSNGAFNKYFYDYLFAIIYEHLSLLRLDKRESLQGEIAAHYIVSAFIGILMWWVDKDMPQSAQEMATLFSQLTMQGFKDTLQTNHV